MAVRVRRPTEEHLARRLARARDQALTYAPTGGSLGGPVPDGLRRRRWSTELGGAERFEPAVAALHGWAAHRGAGLAVLADGPIAVGTHVAVGAPLPVGYIVLACRIVAVVDEPMRFGFAYGTLPGHPARGEESFVVSRDDDGTVRFTVEAVSRPVQLLARLVPPVAHRLQDAAVQRYLAAMR